MSELPHLMLPPRSGRARSWNSESCVADGLLVFAFQHLEQQRELGHFDGLRVDVHAVDVVEQDALALGGGQLPTRRPRAWQSFGDCGRSDRRSCALAHFLRVVGDVPVAVPVQQVLVGAEQERAGAAGGVERCAAARLCRRLDRRAVLSGPEQRAHGVLDDVIDDVGGRVEDAAGFFDFGLFFHHGVVPGGQADDFAQELLVDLAEDVGGQHRELVRAVGVVEVAEDVFEQLVVDVQAGGQAVGRVGAGPSRRGSGTGRSCSARRPVEKLPPGRG